MNLDHARFNMIQQQIRPWALASDQVLALLETVKREAFVPAAYVNLAYADTEIPLGHGAAMLNPKFETVLVNTVKVRRGEKVLLVGAGSGYLAALLAAEGADVVAYEINPALAEQARNNLAQAGITQVSVETGDGLAVSSDEFDLVVLAGAVADVPVALLERVKVGGRLFAFIGQSPVISATLITRGANGNTRRKFFEADVPALRAALAPAFTF